MGLIMVSNIFTYVLTCIDGKCCNDDLRENNALNAYHKCFSAELKPPDAVYTRPR